MHLINLRPFPCFQLSKFFSSSADDHWSCSCGVVVRCSCWRRSFVLICEEEEQGRKTGRCPATVAAQGRKTGRCPATVAAQERLVNNQYQDWYLLKMLTMLTVLWQ